MKKSAALIAVAGLAAAANAQSVTVLVNGSSALTFDTSTYVPSALTVSMTLDTEGAYGDFSSWAAFIGSMGYSHSSGVAAAGDISVPTELATDEATNPAAPLNAFSTDTDWKGRRPAAWGSTLGVPPGGNNVAGSFRFPDQGGFSANQDGASATLDANGGAPINAGQQPAALGNAQHNPSSSIEVFRFDITPTAQIGTYTIEALLNDLAYFIAGNNTSVSGLQNSVSYNNASVTFTPAPSTLALLGLGGLAAGRRRR